MLDGTGRLQSDECMRFPSRCGPMLCLAILLWRVSGWPTPARAGALEDYVSAPDAHYAWREAGRMKTNGATVTHLELTSQEWRSNLWTHHIQVLRPATIRNV